MTAAVFDVPARIRLDTVVAVERAGLAAITAGTTAFSFEALTDIDSTAVAALLAWKRAAAARNATVEWRAVPASLSRLAQLYGVADLLGLAGAHLPLHTSTGSPAARAH